MRRNEEVRQIGIKLPGRRQPETASYEARVINTKDLIETLFLLVAEQQHPTQHNLGANMVPHEVVEMSYFPILENGTEAGVLHKTQVLEEGSL